MYAARIVPVLLILRNTEDRQRPVTYRQVLVSKSEGVVKIFLYTEAGSSNLRINMSRRFLSAGWLECSWSEIRCQIPKQRRQSSVRHGITRRLGRPSVQRHCSYLQQCRTMLRSKFTPRVLSYSFWRGLWRLHAVCSYVGGMHVP